MNKFYEILKNDRIAGQEIFKGQIFPSQECDDCNRKCQFPKKERSNIKITEDGGICIPIGLKRGKIKEIVDNVHIQMYRDRQEKDVRTNLENAVAQFVRNKYGDEYDLGVIDLEYIYRYVEESIDEAMLDQDFKQTVEGLCDR